MSFVKMEINKKLIFFITSGIFSLLLINLGVAIIKKELYISLITILIGVTLLFLTYYLFQIKINEERIKELREWTESKEELLNTLKDIVILKKVSKIK